MEHHTYRFTAPHLQRLPVSAKVCVNNFRDDVFPQLFLEGIHLEIRVKCSNHPDDLGGLILVEPRSDS